MVSLVTGATGFLGRRLVARLLEDGDEVRALVLPAEDARLPAAVEVVRGDITEPGSLGPAARGADAVYHLAAAVGDWGPEDWFERLNVDGTRHVLDAAAAAGCRRVVAVSSVVVYGARLAAGVCDEDAPRERGVGPYSRSKRFAEELALDYHALGRVPVTVVRPGNVYGPGSRPWVDELGAVLRAGRGLLIDGGRGDATLAYVDNVVDILVRAARSERAAGRAYNAADGFGITWARYAADLAALLGCPPPTRSVSRPVARALARVLEGAGRLARREQRPLLTLEAVALLSSREPLPIERATGDLGYHAPVSYEEGLARVGAYLSGGQR